MGDVLSLFSSAIDAFRHLDVPSSALSLRSLVVDSLWVRVKMLLDVDELLITGRECRIDSTRTTEFVFVANSNPRFSKAIGCAYK